MEKGGFALCSPSFLCVMKKVLLFIIYRVYRMRTNQGPCPAIQGCKMTKISKTQFWLAVIWFAAMITMFATERTF
jgi:hypothetical protein